VWHNNFSHRYGSLVTSPLYGEGIEPTAPMALPGVKTVSADPISTSTITPATTAAPVAAAAAAVVAVAAA